MKKLLLIVAVVLFASSAMAQEKGEMAVGAKVVIGMGDSFTNYGIGAKFQWNPANRVRIEPSVTYFIKKDYISMLDVSANVHYLFSVGEKFIVYPLAGIGLWNAKVSDDGFSYSNNEFAFGIGAGAEMPIADRWSLNAEYQYKIVTNMNRSLISIGTNYKF